jgi:hypothetical protein
MSIEDSVMKTTTRQRIGLVLVRYQRKILIFGGLFFTGLGLYLGFSPRGYGASTYLMGIWWTTCGLFLGIRKRHATVMLVIGIVLGLGYWYNSPLLLANFGVGIFVSAVSLLLYANNQRKTRRLSPPKPPWMAIALVAILALGMLSPLGSIHLAAAASAKFEITILDDGQVRCQPGDNRSRYDILIRDNKSVMQYSVSVLNESMQMTVNENGRECSFKLDLPDLPKAERALALASEPRASAPYFWWDRVWFINQTLRTVKYPHPDRETYDIPLWSTWSMYGTKLLHYQIDQATSLSAWNAGPFVIGGLIGALIGTFIKAGEGTVLGFLIGGAVFYILTWMKIQIVLDESDCIWWWVAKNWLHWLYVYAEDLIALWMLFPAAAIEAVTASFLMMGFLRIGSLTYADYVAVGKPGDPETPCIPVIMWEEAYYETKPGGRVCYYDASIGEYIVEYPLAGYDVIPR